MAGLGGIFERGGAAEQMFIWQVVGSIVSALMDPAISELTQVMRAQTTLEPLSPSELAALAARNYLSVDDAVSNGAKHGIDTGNMHHLIEIAGAVPPAEVLIEAVRRGLIGASDAGNGPLSLHDALVRGGLKSEWAAIYQNLIVQNPTWNDALDALLEGQISKAESLKWFKLAGGNPEAFDWLYDSRGTAPTPDMAGTMANRGIIDWDGTGPDKVTFQQAFLEGPWRNKWEPAMRRLMEYHPPPRTVTALLRSGAITQAEALTLFKQQGLSPELAAAYVKDAQHTTAASAKELTKSDIESLYQSHVITLADATKMLADLGYSDSHAKVLLSGVDLRRTISATNSAITRVRSQYTGHKITRTVAQSALTDLGLDAAQSNELLATWDIESGIVIKELTPAQIGSALHLEIVTQDEAIAELTAIGYTPWDAWVLLSVHEKVKLPNEPPRGPAPVARA